MSGADRKRQKKLEKTRKKRQQTKKDALKHEAKFEGANLLRLASSAPFGPCWVSVSLDRPESEEAAPLVSVIVTRRIRGQLLGALALIDRECLGVKNADLLPLQPEQSLLELTDRIAAGMGELRACEPSEAQAVVFHAIDYAASLGFRPHPDFEPALFEPRPDSLRETPLAHPTRPVYISGPHDDVPRILAQLESAVGAQNFTFIGGLGGSWFDEDDEDEYEDEDDELAIETTAETADVSE